MAQLDSDHPFGKRSPFNQERSKEGVDKTTREYAPKSSVEAKKLLGSYVADQLAAVQHTRQALQRHVENDLTRSHPDAHIVLLRLHSILDGQVQALELHLDREYGGRSTEGALKDLMLNVTGFVVGMYGTVRGETVSRMVRDDMTATNFLATCYSMLYSSAAALDLTKTANLAGTHLRELTPLVLDLSDLLPKVVIGELSEQGYPTDGRAIRQASLEITKAWHPAGSGSL